MAQVVQDVRVGEASLDSLSVVMDWSPGRKDRARPQCPCSRHTQESPCPLLFKEIGWGPDQDPHLRATPEELADCPLLPSHDLALRMIVPKHELRERRWPQREKQPAVGLLVWRVPTSEGRKYAFVAGIL